MIKRLDRLRDEMLAAPDGLDELQLPPFFREARAAVVKAIARLERAGVPRESIVAALFAEMLPRMVHQNGPAWTAAMLVKLAENISAPAAASDIPN